MLSPMVKRYPPGNSPKHVVLSGQSPAYVAPAPPIRVRPERRTRAANLREYIRPLRGVVRPVSVPDLLRFIGDHPDPMRPGARVHGDVGLQFLAGGNAV